MSIFTLKVVKKIRTAHKWTGLILGLWLLVIALSGFYLMHRNDFIAFGKIGVPDFLVPSLFEEVRKEDEESYAFLEMGIREGSDPVLLAGTRAGLYKGEGETLETIGPVGRVGIHVLLLTEQRWFSGTNKGLYESLDGGKEWQWVTRGPFKKDQKLYVRALEQSPTNKQVLWLGTQDGKLYQSMDGGAEWEEFSHVLPALPEGEEPRRITRFLFDPNRPERVFIGSTKGLFLFDQGKDMAIKLNKIPGVRAETEKMSLREYLDRLHTGTLLADWLWPLYDLTALAILFFIGSGLYMWSYPSLKRWQKKQGEAEAFKKGSILQSGQPTDGADGVEIKIP